MDSGLGLVAVGVGASSEGEASPLRLPTPVSNLSSFFPPNSLFWSFFALILVSRGLISMRLDGLIDVWC